MWNWKRQEIPKSDEGGFNAVTKPAFWVQITVKNIELTTKIFLVWNIQLVKNYGCFFSLYLWRKNDFVFLQKFMTLKYKNLEKYGSWCSCLLIRKMSRELIVGSQVPLSLQQFYLTKENLKMFYNLEGIQWRPWRRFDQFYEVILPW